MSLPNYITIFRLFLTPIFFVFIVYYNSNHPTFRAWALWIFLIAVLSDALDGAIARATRQRTELGTFLDPLADKLLLLSGFLAIAFSETFVRKPHLWIIIMIVFRDLFIIGGLGIIFFTTNKIEIKPNLLGKMTTFFQMMTLIAVLWEWNWLDPISYTALMLTILSLIVYLFRGIHILNKSSKP